MSHNVQKYDRQVYLRVSEAQRCRVHSTLVMPLFGAASAGPDARPVAVFELVQADRDVAFPNVIAELRKCLKVRGRDSKLAHIYVITRCNSNSITSLV
jgi:nucleolar complex protein 2